MLLRRQIDLSGFDNGKLPSETGNSNRLLFTESNDYALKIIENNYSVKERLPVGKPFSFV